MENISWILSLMISLSMMKTRFCEYQQCSARSIFEPGSAIFGALVDVHHPGPNNAGCGSIAGAQEIEAMKWAVEKINRNGYIPGIKLGMRIHDTCGTPLLALTRAMEFIPNIYPEEYSECTLLNEPELFLGIVGPARSGPTEEVAKALQVFQIPQITYSATQQKLGELYPYLFRTVPPDNLQSRIMVDIVKQLGWTFIAAISTDDNYGMDGMREFIRLAKTESICIAQQEVVPVVASSSQIHNVMEQLRKNFSNTDETAYGAVFFGQAEVAGKLIREQKIFIHEKGYRSLKNLYWIMSDAVALSENIFQHIESTANGIINVSPAFINYPTFRDHWIRLLSRVASANVSFQTNPWLEEYVMTTYQCTIPGSIYKVRLNSFDRKCMAVALEDLNDTERITGLVDKSIDAVYVLATALRNAHLVFCGNNATGLCPELTQMKSTVFVDFIKNVTVSYKAIDIAAPQELAESQKEISFDKNGEIRITHHSPIYYINIFKGNGFKTIGNYSAKGLHLDMKDVELTNSNNQKVSGASLPKSVCIKHCKVCVQKPEIDFVYIPGDFLILGFFSVHGKGKTPFQCGQFRNLTGSLQLVEAFLHSLDNINSGAVNISYMEGQKFGALVFDDCYSQTIATDLLISFLKGRLKLQDRDSNAVIDAEKVVAVIGSFSSSVTINLADILTDKKIPLISYGSTDIRLSDRNTYPYFLRTVPDNNAQAEVMVQLIKYLGWNYVQIVNTDNHYGRSGKEAFITKAGKNGIHVVCDKNDIPADSVENYEGAINSIVEELLKFPEAKAVVFYGDDYHAKSVLKALNARARQGDYLFIGSAGWGHNMEVIPVSGIRGNVALGSFTITYFHKTSTSFDNYFKYLTPGTNKRNPWFPNFWQDYFKCDLVQTYQNIHGKKCLESDTLDMSDKYIQDIRVPYTMDAVYATAIGLMKAMNQLCGSRRGTECILKLRSNPSSVIERIKDANLLDQMSQKTFHPFDKETGNGNSEYCILNIQTDSSKSDYKYVQVGTYIDGALSLDLSKVKLYNGKNEVINLTNFESRCSCKNRIRCASCSDGEPTVLSCGTEEDRSIIIGSIVIAILFLCILIALVANLCRVKRAQSETVNEGRPLPPTPQGGSPEIPPEGQRESAQAKGSDDSECSSIANYQHIQDVKSNLHYINSDTFFSQCRVFTDVEDEIKFENDSDGDSYCV